MTLSKLIAAPYFLRGKYVQAFGVYGSERAGAPVQAFVRVDDEEITLHSPIEEPDHVIVIDPSLICREVAQRMKPGGIVVLNTPLETSAFATMFPGRRVAVIDADTIATDNHLGTQASPIVNTAVFGAVGRLLGVELADVEAALAHVGFGGSNVHAARLAFDQVQIQDLPGSAPTPVPPRLAPSHGFLDSSTDTFPVSRTGDWASRRPRSRELAAVCSNACPAGNDVRGFLQAAARGRHAEALEIILRTSPFPATCGRVCPAPCMALCNRHRLDEPVNIREVERAVAARAESGSLTSIKRWERVAVVGSGPAGLSATYHLARAGFAVTVYERASELGGLLRTGIPSYRLPREVLDHEIDMIVRNGVVVRVGHSVDHEELERLSGEFDAVVVATGLQEAHILDLDGSCPGAVIQGLTFLEGVRPASRILRGQDVVVVGGGNTAVDAARSALRLGARKVQIIYRRGRHEMPAMSEEIEEAEQEGIGIAELLSPVHLRESAQGPFLTCRRMRLGEPDESGRREPVALDGDRNLVTMPCDRLLLALGQSPDLSLLPTWFDAGSEDIARGPAGALVVACGDLATNAGTVAAAIGSGRLAAESICSALDRAELDRTPSPILAGPEVIAFDRFERSLQHRSTILPAQSRVRSFDEVRQGLQAAATGDAISTEADRCLSCGACTDCGECTWDCPEGVLHIGDEQRCSFDYDYCKGCGLCASQCPRGAIGMETGVKEELT